MKKNPEEFISSFWTCLLLSSSQDDFRCCNSFLYYTIRDIEGSNNRDKKSRVIRRERLKKRTQKEVKEDRKEEVRETFISQD
jgi:hypothetical protein